MLSQRIRLPKVVPLPAVVLLACVGCASLRDDCRPRGFSFVHRLAEPPAQLAQACQGVPAEAREHVHLFAINGMDPFYVANLNGLCASMQQLGFRNVHCREAWQTHAIGEQIIAIRRSDPDARIAVLGFSAGANRACQLAQQLKDKKVAIDLLVYLGGDTITNVPESRPANVGQLVNITGHGFLPRGGDLFYNGTDLDGAANQRLDARHMLLPTRSETVETLAQRLVGLTRTSATVASAP
jgi:hypothetical protein